MQQRIVITGIGVTSPLGNDLPTMRNNLLEGRSNIIEKELRYIGKVPMGKCDFNVTKYQNRKEVRRGTRAGSISIYCTHEAINAAELSIDKIGKDNIGVFVGITEHGNVETENEIANIKEFDYDVKYWTHHHNPRTVANNPAGEVCLNLGITGPHCCIGAACAAGNYGLIYGAQQLILGECNIAICGGVSESTESFGIFAGFKSQNALAENADPNKASRPFSKDRNGIVVAEGGAIYILERLEDALERGANIIAELAGWAINTDATDFVLPNSERQAECMRRALKHAAIQPQEIDLISTHATGTPEGDVREIAAIKEVFGTTPTCYINNSKSFWGHAMGAAGALELAGNIPAFNDNLVHPTINIGELDPECDLNGKIVIDSPCKVEEINYILNNSFGMLGINAVLIIKKYK